MVTRFKTCKAYIFIDDHMRFPWRNFSIECYPWATIEWEYLMRLRLVYWLKNVWKDMQAVWKYRTDDVVVHRVKTNIHIWTAKGVRIFDCLSMRYSAKGWNEAPRAKYDTIDVEKSDERRKADSEE